MAKVVEVLTNAQINSSRDIVSWIESKLAGSPWSLVYSVNSTNGKARYFSNGVYTVAFAGSATDETLDGRSMYSYYFYLKLIKTKNTDGTEVPTGVSYFQDVGLPGPGSYPASQTWFLVYTSDYLVIRCPQLNKLWAVFTATAGTKNIGLVTGGNLDRIHSLEDTAVSSDGALITLSDVGISAYTEGSTDVALLPYFMRQNAKIYPQLSGVYRPVGQSQAFLDEVTDGTNNHVIVVPNLLAVRY